MLEVLLVELASTRTGFSKGVRGGRGSAFGASGVGSPIGGASGFCGGLLVGSLPRASSGFYFGLP